MSQQTRRGVLFAAVLIASGCQGAKEVMGVFAELQAVQGAVVKATGHENVTVNLHNNRLLTVGMVNSPFATLPDDRREAKAREIAGLALRSLQSRASVESVAVNFVVHRRYFLLLNYTNALDSFSFKASDLVQPSTQGQPTAARQ